MNRAAQQRMAMRRLIEALSSMPLTASPEDLVAEEACRLTDAGCAVLCVVDAAGEMLDCVAAAGDNSNELVGLRTRVADSLSASVVADGRPVVFDSGGIRTDTGDLFAVVGAAQSATATAADPSPARAPRRPTALSVVGYKEAPAGVSSAAVVPITTGGRVIGTLAALNKAADSAPSDTFDGEDVDALLLLAETASLGIGMRQSARLAREQARELTALRDVAATVAASLNVQEIMDGVLESVCAHVETHRAALFLLNDERTHLFIEAERGLGDAAREVQLSVGAGIAGSVMRSGEPLLLTTAEIERDFEGLLEGAAAHSGMIAPMRTGDDTHGIILVTSLQKEAYHAEDVTLLMAVATQAGLAMQNAWFYEEAQRQAEEVGALYDLSQHINSTLNLDRVLGFVADSVLNVLRVDRFALLMYDQREERLVTRLSRNVDEDAFRAVKPRVGEGIAGWVYGWQTPQAVADVAADPRNRAAPIDGFGVASALGVPMQVGEDVIGVVMAMSSKRRLFTVAEMELLYTIANQAAVAIVNATLYQDARARSREMRRFVRRVGHAVGAALRDKEVPQLLADLAVEIMRADRCVIYGLEDDELRLQAASRFRPGIGPDPVVAMGVGLCGWVARRGQSLMVEDLEHEARSRYHEWLSQDRQSSYLGVPLKSGRQTVGVMEIYSHARHEFRKEEANLLSTFARRARLAERMLGSPA